jgi:hypothetical protein
LLLSQRAAAAVLDFELTEPLRKIGRADLFPKSRKKRGDATVMSNDDVDIYEYSVKLRFSPKFWGRISHQVEQLLYSDVADYIIEAIELKLMADEDLERRGERQP